MAAFRSLTALRAASAPSSSSLASSSLLRPSLAASHASPSSLAIRAFSTSRALPASHPAANAKQSYIQGTVNEPTTYPPPNPAHGHYHWIFERAISVALLPLTAAAVAKHGASGVLDAALGLSLVAHSHIGFDACLQDYLHKRKFPIAGPVAQWILKFSTAGALVGLYELQTNDVGLTEIVARVWTA